MNQRFMQQLENVFDVDGNEASLAVLENEVDVRVKRRFGNIGETVKSRLAHEFELIRATNTAKLFLYWADMVAAIKRRTYPYICGSQNCSLVCYSLGITEVNPLLTGSYSERLLNSRRTLIPRLFIEVPKGQGAEASKCLDEEGKVLIEIEENSEHPNLDPKEVFDFFKEQTYGDREILQIAAASLKFDGQVKLPETLGELVELLVHKRYTKFMDELPSLLYQEDAFNLLVKAGLSGEEADCLQRACIKKDRVEINFYRNVLEQTARKNGYSISEANAIFSAVEKEGIFTVGRASCVAMAQYLYMDTFFKEKQKG